MSKLELEIRPMKNKTKGFDPENLTFDGVPILEGDEVIIRMQGMYAVAKSAADKLGIILCDEYFMYLEALNIQNHLPKQKSELEIAEEELERLNRIKNQKEGALLVRCVRGGSITKKEFEDLINGLYKAWKDLENFKSKNY